MISRRGPRIGTVANITVQTGRNMIGFFARGNIAIMTAATTAPHFIVIHFRRRRPAGFSVATIAGIRRICVRCPFTFCRGAIMTA